MVDVARNKGRRFFVEPGAPRTLAEAGALAAILTSAQVALNAHSRRKGEVDVEAQGPEVAQVVADPEFARCAVCSRFVVPQQVEVTCLK